MRPVVAVFVCATGVVGCPSPCVGINDVIVSRYDECGLALTEDLQDGGRSFLGTQCAASVDEAACVEQCWMEASCEVVAGNNGGVGACANDCYVF